MTDPQADPKDVELTPKQVTDLTKDAKNRAFRTILQGLGIDVITGVVLVIGTAFTAANGWSDFQWAILGFSVAKSVVQSVVSFVMRRFLDPSKIPTPLPPKAKNPVVA